MTVLAREELVWRSVEEAPANKIVLTAGGVHPRFMRMDENGQWRSMIGQPRTAPKAWAMIPTANILSKDK